MSAASSGSGLGPGEEATLGRGARSGENHVGRMDIWTGVDWGGRRRIWGRDRFLGGHLENL